LAGDLSGFVETDNILKPFIDRNKKVVFVPGNWDSDEVSELFTKMYGAKNVGKHYVKYGDVGIFGVGNEFGELDINEDKSFKKLKKDFGKIKDLEKKIMISHIHAAGSKAEFSGISGSTSVRRAIEEFQPDVFLAGHIHEAEGLSEKIGKTRVFNVGEKGKIIEI